MKRAAAVVLSAGLAPAAAGQVVYTSDADVTMTMVWSEATATGGTVPNPDGVLEPGESALIRVSSIFVGNQFGVAHFSPSIGTFSSGTVLALAAGNFDINGSGGAEGTFNISSPPANNTGTSGFGVRSTYRVSSGRVNSAGVSEIEFLMYSLSAPGGPSTVNPSLNMYRMLWTPATYGARSVGFGIAAPASDPRYAEAIFLDLGQVGASVLVTLDHINFGSVVIPVVPGPAGAAPLLVGAALFVRRRRP